jgi:hypothetical protein
MFNRVKDLRCCEALGVLEWWSTGVMGKKDAVSILHRSITPISDVTAVQFCFSFSRNHSKLHGPFWRRMRGVHI